VPKYSAPVAVADVLVVFGTATMNSAAVGNGIGNVAVRDEQYPHCGYAFPIASHLLLPAPVSLTVNPFLVRLVI
jgi:hypothetical protein